MTALKPSDVAAIHIDLESRSVRLYSHGRRITSAHRYYKSDAIGLLLQALVRMSVEEINKVEG